MSCCGKKREALRTRMMMLPPSPTVFKPPALSLQNPTKLAYRGESSIVVRGSHTGLSYLFSGDGAALTVDERDVAELVATGWFHRL
jgi:hypothetical protein